MSVLLIDVGNTRIKWRLRTMSAGTPEQLHYGVLEHDDVHSMQWPDASQVVVSCVSHRPELHQQLLQRFGQTLKWLDKTPAKLGKIKHCYADPSRLGIDRWLGMLGARQHYSTGGLVLVDAGTAMTVDVVDECDQHLGGYIVPGLTMARQALFQGTQRVRPYADERQILHDSNLGQNTVSCVDAGTLKQLRLLVQSMRDEYPDYQLLLTGGDAQLLSPFVSITPCSDLIFDGLESLCAGLFTV
ncbi:MAG: type III pantothenate kinase [Oleibacter sp.]|nr:type III pantothenate kinase [Thalassolituus sp.]